MALVTVHGRTRNQFYKGKADWSAIQAVADAVTIPLIANGDVLDEGDAPEILRQSGADGLMIGRGGLWSPLAAGLYRPTISKRVSAGKPLMTTRYLPW